MNSSPVFPPFTPPFKGQGRVFVGALLYGLYLEDELLVVLR